MLAELAAANAAFQILKQTVQNGRDIMSAGKSIASIVDAEEKLRTKGAKKKIVSGSRSAAKTVLILMSLWLCRNWHRKRKNLSQ